MSLFKKRMFKRLSALLTAALLLLQMLLPVVGVSAAADYTLASDRAYTWLKAQQDLTAGFALEGLVDSFDDWWNATDRVQKVYTYDQAVAAIAFMLKDDRVRAEKVLSKMAAIQDPDGSWINSYWWNGFGEEIRKHVGPTAWMVMAYMMYEKKYGATTYQPNVKKALDWAVTFQKPNGGISGGRTQWDVPNTWTDEVWTSTEHNEDMYPVLKYYANVFPDRTSTYNTAATNVKSFLDNVVWNDTLKRWNGGWKNNTGLIDPSVPMDVNPWGVLALGLTGTRDYKQAIAYVDNANGTGTVDSPKYVQTLDYDGQGHMMTAYDFDWEYDCAQATTPTGQPSGLKCADIWLEGSAFMSTVHYMNGNVVKSNSILDEMIKKQGTSGTLLGGLPYSLKGSNNNYWQMAQENCVSSTGWLIIAIARYNPFTGQSLTANGPNINSLSPNAGPAGSAVTVSGSGFGATQGTSTVKFGTATATVTAWSNTSITATVPSGLAAGSVNVAVTVNGTSSNASAFTVTTGGGGGTAPAISSLNPTSGAVGTSVTIAGSNFGATQGTSTVKFGATTATATAWSATSITATVPSGLAAGAANVTVTVGGLASNAAAFTVTTTPPPSGDFTQSAAALGSNTLQITFTPATASNYVILHYQSPALYGGAQQNVNMTASGAAWTYNLTPIAAGNNVTYWFTYTKNGLQQPDSAQFSYTFGGGGGGATPPSITSLSPTSGPAGTSVTITGANFGATQGTSSVKFGATTATASAWSATSITATVPSGLAAGAANVTVTVGGTASNASAFTVTAAPPGLASNVLFARSPGALSFTAGAGATNDTIAAAAGNYDGVPHSFKTYTISGINATYDSLKSTAFNLFIDAGTNVGDAVQVQVIYDFKGDGTQLRTETYNYFATNNVAGVESYTQAKGLKSSTGTFTNMTNGKVTIKVWNAIGNTSTLLRVNASAANGSQSAVNIPFK